MAKTAFDKLDVWNHAVELAVLVHDATEDCEHHYLSDRMLQSAVSIAALIAEGAERASLKHFLHHVHRARGAAAELRTHLHLAERIGALQAGLARALHDETMVVTEKLHRLARSLGHSEERRYILPPVLDKDTEAPPRRGRPAGSTKKKKP
ncbi:four helix bundle protein [Wenzhouxiangella sp. XN79A]|uniref:four helix bundle protein n=1 Tax=Wenzhouxiangella sp. XN79A TaxID=2724193 RepID=UPI00144A6471|nr:four helix bundle protein [Wenzhouxiangella sp. XN79A]NKI36416.1 four helix bundle protein [Wenzhouxiangella sp. XN79A]